MWGNHEAAETKEKLSTVLSMMIEARLDEREKVLDTIYKAINNYMNLETVSATALKKLIDEMRR